MSLYYAVDHHLSNIFMHFLSIADKNWTWDLAMEEKNIGQCMHGFSWKLAQYEKIGSLHKNVAILRCSSLTEQHISALFIHRREKFDPGSGHGRKKYLHHQMKLRYITPVIFVLSLS